MYERPAGVAVRVSLASMAHPTSRVTESDTALLHERIAVAVDELRSMGWRVERIIVRLKEVAKEVGFQPQMSRLLTAVEIERREVVWNDTIKQCIERYYGPVRPSNAAGEA